MASQILVNIGSGNGLSPAWHQAITWTIVDELLIRPSGISFNVILIEIEILSLNKMHLNVLFHRGKFTWKYHLWPFFPTCPNVLIKWCCFLPTYVIPCCGWQLWENMVLCREISLPFTSVQWHFLELSFENVCHETNNFYDIFEKQNGLH